MAIEACFMPALSTGNPMVSTAILRTARKIERKKVGHLSARLGAGLPRRERRHRIETRPTL
jgi:hypothetical protein